MQPIITAYAGVVFRSRLEALWAQKLQRLGLEWEYEPTTLQHWRPDFRISTPGATLYAEVKPAIQLPRKAAEKIERSNITAPALLLGANPGRVWLYLLREWQPHRSIQEAIAEAQKHSRT